MDVKKMKVKQVIAVEKTQELEITGATLLSVEESEKLPIELRKYDNCWWLRSRGYRSDLAISVYSDGSVGEYGDSLDRSNNVVRPALQIKNLDITVFKIGDTFEFGGKEFKIISENLAFCLTDIGSHCFIEDLKSEDANAYEKSDVKKFVDAWFESACLEQVTIDDVLSPVFRQEDMCVKLLKVPSEKDWEWVKTCTLNTVGKESTSAPTEEWKVKLLNAEHSPIRELWFGIKMTVPYWVSVHFVRHHIGVNHYVQSQRNDRQEKYDRTQAPQGEFVSHIMSVNAQELVQMAHKRLCGQASKETRRVMQMIVDAVVKECPEFKDVLVPLCEYRNGLCTEFHPCGYNKKFDTVIDK